MIAPQQFPIARQSAGFAPFRRAGSIRRTTSIDSVWPDGFGTAWLMRGQGRDLYTPADGSAPRTIAAGSFEIRVSPEREILAIAAMPAHPRLAGMVGLRGGGSSRKELVRLMGDISGTPLFQLLDDFAGASLVAAWIWSRWSGEWLAQARQRAARLRTGRGGRTENVCTGFATGASSLAADGFPDFAQQSATAVGPLENPDDRDGWHAMPPQVGPQTRRARRLDIWREQGALHIDAGFQDSGSNPEGGRTAVHEYRVHAQVDAMDHRLVALEALPLILPYRECPGAAPNARRLVGMPVADLRDSVTEILPGPLGCTHLNDVLRALADVPVLAKWLE